jgi:hypothetical protein
VRHDEEQEQSVVIAWAALNCWSCPDLRWLHSTLNGVPLSPAQARRAKSTGLKRGVSDLFLDVRRGVWSGLRIELKRPPGPGRRRGTTTTEQVDWLEHYRSNGFYAVVCYGADEAIDTIRKYLE